MSVAHKLFDRWMFVVAYVIASRTMSSSVLVLSCMVQSCGHVFVVSPRSHLRFPQIIVGVFVDGLFVVVVVVVVSVGVVWLPVFVCVCWLLLLFEFVFCVLSTWNVNSSYFFVSPLVMVILPLYGPLSSSVGTVNFLLIVPCIVFSLLSVYTVFPVDSFISIDAFTSDSCGAFMFAVIMSGSPDAIFFGVSIIP